jgi:peptidoglycan/LPS O-acetylase OafA/YrhL
MFNARAAFDLDTIQEQHSPIERKAIASYPIGFNPSLAALRGIAVILVVLYHCGTPGFRGGFLGVDIFFVLSGYLITCTLIKQFDGEKDNFFIFYWRRFLRLFPAFALVCVALYLARGFLGNADQPIRDILAAGLYVSNWTRAYHNNAPIYLAHSWSLAIEEQFYLVWPIILLFLLKLSGRKTAATFALALAISVMLWRAFAAWTGASPDRLYNSFDLRSDGLLLGCALALYTYRNRERSLRIAYLSVRLLFIAAPAFLFIYFRCHFEDQTMFYAGYAVSNISVAAAVSLLTAREDYSPKRVLALFPLVYVGEISYGLYLWHFPISYVLATQYHFNGAVRALIVCASSLALASLSFYIVEKPALSLKRVSIGRRLGALSLAANACAIAAGVWIFWQAVIIGMFREQKAVITSYGPAEVRQGIPFNPQPDGTSAMWVKTASDVRHDTQIQIDGTAIPTSVSFNLITAIVPSNLVHGLGDHVVTLVCPDRSQRSNEVKISVLP